MKTLFLQIFVVVLLLGFCVAQQPDSSQESSPAQQAPSNTPARPAQSVSPQNGESIRIAPGSVIPAQLTKSIDAKKAKTGDAVEARITQDLKAQNGELVLAKDTKVLGHITQAEARTKEQKQSQVGIVFEKVVPKDANGSALPLTIQAIVIPSNSAANDSGASAGNGAGSTGQPVPAPSGGMSSGNMGRPSTTSAPTQQSSTAGDAASAHDQGGQPQITAETHGVVGDSKLKLSASANAAEGSLVSSEKGNVKLDNGTFLLLRVNP